MVNVTHFLHSAKQIHKKTAAIAHIRAIAAVNIQISLSLTIYYY